MNIQPIAKMNAIKKAVDLIPGCACISVTAQSDYFLVHLSEYGVSRVIHAEDAAHTLRILSHYLPEKE